MDDTEARPHAMVLEFKEDRPLTEVSLPPSHLLLHERNDQVCLAECKQRMHAAMVNLHHVMKLEDE